MERLVRTPIDPEPDFGIRAALDTSDKAWREADAKRTAYRRNDTSEIPRKMLKPGMPLGLDDIYAMLHVYYWWDEEWLAPEDCLDDLLEDLDKQRFKQAVRVLHSSFASYCCAEDEDTGVEAKELLACEMDGWECFSKYTSKHRISQRDYPETVSILLDGIDEEVDGPIAVGLREYGVRKMMGAGCDAIEASYGATLLAIEEERRENADRYGDEIDELRRANIAPEDGAKFLRALLMSEFILEEYFHNVVDYYEDIPDDWKHWDVSKKRALVTRWLDENGDLIDSLVQTYEQERFGIKPSYLYRARPANIFPGEV